MFKGLITKAVKDMVVDPIMNPAAPPAPDTTPEGESAPTPTSTSEFDPDAFDRHDGEPTSAFDPDSFDVARSVRTRSPQPTRHEADPGESRALIAETWDIDLPFHPGEGTTCGSACRCTWLIEKRWSPENGCDAIFATWVATGGPDACPDCQQRAADWSDVFVRPAFDNEN